MDGKPDRGADFAVIGAGLAGLAAALGLSAAGAEVTVFEARERVGGRVVSAPRPPAEAPPLVLDLGAQWVGPGQTRILSLIKELGLHLDAADTPGRTLWGIGGELKQGGATLPPLPPLALAEVLASAALLTLMSKSIQPVAPWTAKKARQWDRVSADDWISPPSTHPPPAASSPGSNRPRQTPRLEPRETSVLGILFDLRSIGRSRDLGTAEAFRVREGTHEIARRLAERLGGKIHYGRARASHHPGRQWSYGRDRRLGGAMPPGGGLRTAATRPARSATRPHFPTRDPGSWPALRWGPTVKFHAVYRRPVLAGSRAQRAGYGQPGDDRADL
jgi:monoamine oxidase